MEPDLLPAEASTPTPIPVPAPVPAGAPVISSFVASPLAIVAGGSSTLSWQATDATSVEISHGIGSVSLSGTRSVSPSATTTYTLTAHGPGGDATATVQISVDAPAALCVPSLFLPADGATLDNGRTDGVDPLVWDFDWSDCPGATRYQLYVKLSGSSSPVISDSDLVGSAYHHVSNGYIGSGNLIGWSWMVRARVEGQWSDWSPEQLFEVEPPNTDPGPTVCVPSQLSPSSGATLDNGRTDGSNPTVWDFDWSDCPGATRYELYVKHIDALNPVIQRSDLVGSAYHHVSSGYIGSGNLTGWYWRVRARVGGQWGDWTPTRSFRVEPPNTD